MKPARAGARATARGIVFGVARIAAQIESVPTMAFVGTVLTVQKESFWREK